MVEEYRGEGWGKVRRCVSDVIKQVEFDADDAHSEKESHAQREGSKTIQREFHMR